MPPHDLSPTDESVPLEPLRFSTDITICICGFPASKSGYYCSTGCAALSLALSDDEIFTEPASGAVTPKEATSAGLTDSESSDDTRRSRWRTKASLSQSLRPYRSGMVEGSRGSRQWIYGMLGGILRHSSPNLVRKGRESVRTEQDDSESENEYAPDPEKAYAETTTEVLKRERGGTGSGECLENSSE
jgi:hypothetical protein